MPLPKDLWRVARFRIRLSLACGAIPGAVPGRIMFIDGAWRMT